jgi:hypothetical protein
MLVFISLALALCYIEESANVLQTLLASSFFIYAGLTIASASIVGLFIEKIPEKIGYEVFSSSTLFVWYAYWKTLPLFKFGDSPIFFYFPLFLAVMSAFITLFLSNQNHRIDKVSLSYMRHLEEERLIPSWSLMLCVLISLVLEEHYTLYPVLMTLLMLRFAFSNCLIEVK